MHNSIKALIFDFGGVLIKWDPRRIFQKFFPSDTLAMESFMAEIGFPEWNQRQDEGYPFQQAVLDMSARFPQYAHIIQAYDVSWEESITGTIPGTVELLYRLKGLGYPIYGLTNWNLDKFNIIRHRYGFFSLFELIIVSGEVKMVKPNPEIYHLLLERTQRQPSECLMIDDSEVNIEASQKLGFPSIRFSSPEQLETELIRLNLL